MFTSEINNMLNQYQVPSYIVNELPEIEHELNQLSTVPDIFKIIKCLSNYTKSKVIQHDFKTVKKCFLLADNIYSEGNTIVKNAIECVFVYSFSSLMSVCNKEDKRKIHALVPIYLYTAYVQQEFKPVG